MKLALKPWQTFLVGAGLFVPLMFASQYLFSATAPIPRNAIFKAVLAALCLLLMKVDGRGFAEFGFRRPQGVRWSRAVGSGLLLGALATLAILASPAQGMQLMKGASLGQIVLGIWLWSSLTEEIFTRGLLQTWTLASQEVKKIGGFSVPVWTAALFFGAMHLSLLYSGTDGWTVAILVTAATLLGLLAGRYRERSGSLLPAFVNHLSFNVGGFLGGATWMIASRLLA
jgi:membrane protease YdiL (CAAX protease family)